MRVHLSKLSLPSTLTYLPLDREVGTSLDPMTSEDRPLPSVEQRPLEASEEVTMDKVDPAVDSEDHLALEEV